MVKIKRINLVAGGAGFIGSHLIDNLIKKNEKVICLDDFSTGLKSNIDKWETHPDFSLIEEDILNPINILSVDRIWHLACPASPAKYQNNPIRTSKIIFNGTMNILELGKKNKAEIFYASSSEIYGDPIQHPQLENYYGNVNTIGLRSCYEEGKRIAETLCNDFKRIYNLNISIMRIFNTYGPRMRPNDGRVISNFISQSLKGKPLTIYGNGLQTRSFCFINDTIDGIIKLMDSKYYGPLNIGNPEEITIEGLAKMIISKVDPSLKIKYLDKLSDDPLKRKPSILKAKDEIDWAPKINLQKGLDLTINDFKKRINSNYL